MDSKSIKSFFADLFKGDGTSPYLRLDRNDLIKLGRSFLISICGIFLIFIGSAILQRDLGGEVLFAFAPFIVNFGKLLLQGVKDEDR